MNILSILREYQLDHSEALQTRLEKFSASDWLSLSNALDKYYASIPISQSDTESRTPLTFFFPSLPPRLLPSISTHMIVADRVFLDDPLYDIVTILGEYMATEYPWVRAETWIARELLVKNAVETIKFYLRTKEVIEEKKLIPHKQLTMPKFTGEFQKYFKNAVEHDKRLQFILSGTSHRSLMQGLTLTHSTIARLLNKPDIVRKSKSLTNFAILSPKTNLFSLHSVT